MDLSKALWRKASKSKEDGSNCVEVASVSCNVAVRDSKDPDGPPLLVSRGDFRRFTEILKNL
ncbi:DUF397 domain-containing protein [Actinomadura luteofluorescens]|uniref:DUF397 domain-containing protein n=1 Tax=Actinomadura luteofluorescens TaxID=46163 RepID=A0A7Y9JHK8_9ACTN|nr:DUF397 domain-containing protein [Actinomadura luteofluorescens]NYD48683.1 hypothetical protein [Actinomadura luteofluorescens]